MSKPSDLVQGTLDLLLLKILALEPLHGWAIRQRLKQVSGDILQVSDGSLYSALHKLEQGAGLRPNGRQANWEGEVRLHHRLVQIHPFPNGNVRHSRLMADLLVMKLGRERFSWGSTNLQDAGTVRASYISALQAAGSHDYCPLLEFARS